MLRYDLDRLGWSDFEALVKALLKVALGIGVEAMSSRADEGLEAWFYDELTFPGRELNEGPFVFQCKFVEHANAAGAKADSSLLNAVKKEAKSIRSRRSNPKKLAWLVTPRNYVLITNANPSTHTRWVVRGILSEVIPSCQVHILAGPDICALIDGNSRVTLAFPQLFSLAALGDILALGSTKATRTRSKIAIEQAERIAPVFVPTSPYYEALTKLDQRHFVALEGPPEMGKTSIGRMIALARVRDGWEAIECAQPDEVLSHYHSDRRQVFVADDCFGKTDYKVDRVSRWQDELKYVLPRLNTQHELILTTRAHLLEMAKSHLDISGYNEIFPSAGEVLVNAADLSEHDKVMILYRHAKHAGLKLDVRQAIKQMAPEIVRHQHFTPERIRRLVEVLKREAT